MLLIKVIRFLMVNAGVAALVVVIVKIVGDTGLGIGQAGEDGPVARFKFLRFEAGPETFGLRIVVAFAASAVRAQGLGSAQQGLAGVAARCPPRSEWTMRPGAGRWASSARCKARVTRPPGKSARNCRPTTCLVHAS